MTRRDLAWRASGIVVFAAAATLGILSRGGDAAVLGLPAFCLAVLGTVLILQGRRVPAALRIERSEHRALARAIHERRRQRSGPDAR